MGHFQPLLLPTLEGLLNPCRALFVNCKTQRRPFPQDGHEESIQCLQGQLVALQYRVPGTVLPLKTVLVGNWYSLAPVLLCEAETTKTKEAEVAYQQMPASPLPQSWLP